MRPWVWRNFRIKLPDGWEMLQFSRKSAAGSCAFADRYQYRLEFSWKMFSGKAAGRPDVKRVISDYCAKLVSEGQMPDARPIEVGGWRGLVGHVRGSSSEGRGSSRGRTLTTRFGGYYSGESCLVELVFTWPDGRDRRLEKSVLKSVKEEPVRVVGTTSWTRLRRVAEIATARPGSPQAEPAACPERSRGVDSVAGRPYRRWKAFGMDVLASGGLELERCKVEPARALMEFGVPIRGGTEAPPDGKERFERLGMTSHWLRKSVGEWLERRVLRESGRSRELRGRSRASDLIAGHKVETVRGFLPVKGLPRLVSVFTGGRIGVQAAAWICPADGRLYFCRVDRRMIDRRTAGDGAVAGEGGASAWGLSGPDVTDGLSLAGGRLSCCALLPPVL